MPRVPPKRTRSSLVPPASAAPQEPPAAAPSPRPPPRSKRSATGSSRARPASPMPAPTVPTTTEQTLIETNEPPAITNHLQKTKILEKPQARRILKSYIGANGFGKWATAMFQEFLTIHIPHCITNSKPIVASHEPTRSKHTITLSNVRFGPPSIDGQPTDPYSCRINKRMYAVPLIVDVTYRREPLTTAELAQVMEQNANTRRRRGGALSEGSEDATVLPLDNADELVFKGIEIDQVPLMVNSDFCAWKTSMFPELCKADQLDVGKYFVVDGSEKIIVGQEVMRTNYPVVSYKESKGCFVCEVRSNSDLRLRSSSTFYIQVVPAIPMSELPTTTSRVNAGCQLLFCLPYSKFLPMPLLFKVLDVTSIDEMLDFICKNNCSTEDPPWFRQAVANALMHNMTAFNCTKADAMARIKADRTFVDTASMSKTVVDTLHNEFLPHQGTTEEATLGKLVLLGQYVRKTLRVFFGLQAPDDREHYKYRRNISTFLMSMLFRDSYAQWCRQIQKRMQTELNDDVRVLDIGRLFVTNVSRKLRTAIRTGNFTIRQGRTGGVSNAGQALSRIEPYAHIGQVLRTNAHGESFQARMMHPSQIGVVDAYDTPDGGSVGQTRNMSAYAGVRAGYMTNELCEFVVSALGTLLLPLDSCLGYATVAVNGCVIGRIADPWAGRERLRTFRESRDLPADVGLFVDSTCNNTLVVDGDMGAFYWPLLRVDRLHLLPAIVETTPTPFLWDELLNQGVAELITKGEEDEHVRVAFYQFEVQDPTELPGVTHMVIDLSQINSVYAQKGENPEFDQGPRISYAAGMRKQTAGRAPTVPSVDTCLNVLVHPQRKIITNTFDTIMDELSDSIQVCHVGILCDPNNIEDALIVNRASIDRGWGMVMQYHTVTDLCVLRDTEAEQFGIVPADTVNRVVGLTELLDPATGVVRIGAHVTTEHILVGKYAHVGPRQAKTPPTYCDRSLKSKYEGQVERVHWFATPQGQPAVSVTLRTLKQVEVGDKVASEHAQKTSIARIVNQEDMPFDAATGMPLDIAFNPHAMPSRMTIGHLLEQLQTQIAAVTGIFVDAGPGATSEPYVQIDDNRAIIIDDLLDRLRELGLTELADNAGKSEVISGCSGEPLECRVFTSMQAIMRLKHMVNDKYHARWLGPIDPKTRQPVDGRQKEGGLRVGEMERDCMVAHGAANVLKDRLCDSSDATKVDVCTQCGGITHGGERLDGVHSLCRDCVTYTGVPCVLPYAATLNKAELQAMHVDMSFIV